MKVKLLSLLLLCLAAKINAQNLLSRIGARGSAMAFTTASASDEWSIWHNPAGLAGLKQASAATSYELPAFIGGAKMATVINVPVSFGSFSAAIGKFGDQLYHEQNALLGFGNTFGIASMGARVELIQHHAEGEAMQRAVTVSLGGIVALTPRLSIGAYIINMNQPSITPAQRLPARMSAGIRYQPIEHITACAEVEKSTVYPPSIKGAIEYVIYQKLFLRTGFVLRPNTACLGLGFKAWKFISDYSIRYNSQLGYTQQVSAGVKFIRSKNKG